MAALLLTYLLATSAFAAPALRDTAPTILPPSIAQNLGQYSPYYNAATYTAPPASCTLSQVNILERHGARYPTKSSTKSLKATIANLQNPKTGVQASSPLGFILNYQWDLGKKVLVKLGAQESYDAGNTAYGRYETFVTSSGKAPFVRTTSSSRCVDSATNWTQGFQDASQGSISIAAPLIFPEKNFNNTLDNANCPAYSGKIATQNEDEYASNAFPPVTARLSSTLSPPPSKKHQITDLDTVNLMEMCAFESVAAEQESQFCGLFQTSDWPFFEYFLDLDKYYGTGYGNPLGPIQGVGYINELLARLTGTPVNDGTNTNRTLTSDPTTFPLDRPLYADFSHDNEIVAIVSAIGLFKDPQPLSLTQPDEGRKWVFSRIAPFAGRVVVERLQCGGETNVRILVDDAVQVLDFCEGATSDGLCSLDSFVKSQSYATSNGNGGWSACFAS